MGKSFRSKRSRSAPLHVFADISFELAPGKTIGITGASGSGKTTLGRIAAGIDSATAGEVRYRGRRVEELKGDEWRRFRRRVQMLFQDPEGALNPAKSTGTSLDEVARLIGLHRDEREDAVSKSLAAVHLSPEILSRTPGKLSGGQNQRVALARVLMLSPEVIVLDEPTSALDVSVQAGILRLLKDLQSELGLSFLFISHDAAVVDLMCDEVISLDRQGQPPETASPGPRIRFPSRPGGGGSSVAPR